MTATPCLREGKLLDLGVKLRTTEFFFFLSGKLCCQLKGSLQDYSVCSWSKGQQAVRFVLILTCPSFPPEIPFQSGFLLAEPHRGFSALGHVEFILIRCLLNLCDTKTSFSELMCSSYFN